MENNYATDYQGRTYDYGGLGVWERILCFLIGLMLFGVAWIMFKPVDMMERLCRFCHKG